MYNSDIVYGDMDLFSNSNNLFAINNSNNIWSSDKLISMELGKSKIIHNASSPFVHQDRNPRGRKPPGDRRDTNLIVNYLPDGFYEKELYDLFSQAGAIVHHHVVRNKDNRSECYGFVDFEKSSDAERAIDMFHQFQIQNKKLKVQNAAEGLMIKEEERQRTIKCMTNVGYNVEIRNAPSRWTLNDVKNIFGKYGELVKAYENATNELENYIEFQMKTFNVVYRYYTIASKVVKMKIRTSTDALWPLELKMSIIGQEIIEPNTEGTRSRQKSKGKFDQLSDSSWENKLDFKSENAFYQNNMEGPISYWIENTDVNQPLNSNGRPILKHKDNLMHLNNLMYEPIELSDKWSNPLADTTNSFFENIRGSCNDIKAIWAPKEDLIPVDIYIKTPLIPSRFRGDDKNRHKANIWYKMENMQPTGSFKLRGVAFWCHQAKLEGIHTVISSSGGNAGLAAAYSSRLLNMKCIVIVPRTTPVNIIAELLKENAEVIQEGSTWKEAHIKAEKLSLMTHRCKLLHPFDNPLLWSGYEGMVDEIVADMKGARIDMIVLSVGGGGLLNGIAQGITKNKLSKTTAILALETEGCACFNRSIVSNQMVSVVTSGVATSLAVPCVCQRTWDIYNGMEFHLFSKTCSDFDAIESCVQFLNEQNCLVEPACGASLSAVYNGTLDKMAECRNSDLNVVVIVCGGRCVDIEGLMTARHNLSFAASSTTSTYESYNEPTVLHDQFNCLDLNKECYTAPDVLRVPVQPAARNYASVLSDRSMSNHKPTVGKSPFGARSNVENNRQPMGTYHHSLLGDVPSPVGSQNSDKENYMVLH